MTRILPQPAMVDNLLAILRNCVLTNLELHQYETACYWADKLVCLSNHFSKDVLLYAHALYRSKQFHRAISILTNHKELMHSLVCRYRIALCHYACGEYTDALNILNENEQCPLHMLNTSMATLVTGLNPKRCQSNTPRKSDKNGDVCVTSNNNTCDVSEVELSDGCTVKSLRSAVALLKGKIHEGLDNRVIAAQHYREALLLDVTCYEAFEKLVHFQSLTSAEGASLLSSLDFLGQLDPQMAKLVEFLYEDKLSKRSVPASKVPEGLDTLHTNVDVQINYAERMLDLCQFQQAYSVTSRIMGTDPYNLHCLPIHITILKELDKPNELFDLSHRLMNVYPSHAIAWFAVGCYYICTNRNELARRHLLKASQLDKRFGPAWLALGHAFASDGEHDQAIASYCTAAQVIRGSHVPIMYIGIEYSASNNRNLAERFLKQAYQLNVNDPFVLHESGTLAFQTQKYPDAIHLFCNAYDRACDLAGQVPSSFWEPLVNNMAHTYRKLGVYDRAIGMHQIALRLIPDSPTTLAGLGLVCAMTGRLTEAVDYLHRSLRVHASSTGVSTFASTLLGVCVELLTKKSSEKRNAVPGKDITDSPPQKHFPAVGLGTVPGAEKIRFKKRSPDVSGISKSSANALHLDVAYHSMPSGTPDRSLDTSDEDVTMELG